MSRDAVKFDVLEPSQKIDRHLFIEASAGTGKTFTIEHLVVRRILEPLADGTFLTLRDIAVITFTNACAMELSLRIKNCICKAIQALDDPSLPQLPYLFTIHAAGSESVANALRRLRSALYSFPEATISTIHSFCLRLISSYEKKTVTPVFVKDVEESIRDFLAYGQRKGSFFPEQIALLIKSHGGFVELLSAIRKNLWQDEYYSTVTTVTAAESYQLLLQEAAALKMTSEEVRSALLEECERYKGVKTREGKIQPDVLQKIGIFAQLFSGTINKEELIWNPFIIDEVFSDVKAKAPPSKRVAFIEAVKNSIQPHLRALSESGILFKRLVAEAALFVAELQDRTSTISIERVLKKMWQVVKYIEGRDDGVRQLIALRGNYRTVIIDEFQDTDPLQWKIISQLYLETAPSSLLYLVGDPKQSIYRFRGADIYSYLLARGSLAQGDVSSLVTNYRSTAMLNEALNILFAGHHARKLFQLKDIPQMVQAQHLMTGRNEGGEVLSGAALSFCIVTGRSGRSGAFPTHEMEEGAFLPLIVQSVGEEMKKGSAKSFAVIVKDRYQAKRVISYLKDRGFSAVGLSPIALQEKRSVQCMQRLITCLKQPRRKGGLSALLMAWPFFFDETCVKHLGSQGEQALRLRASYAERFLHLRKLLEEGGIGPFYDALLQIFPRMDKESLYDFEYLFELLAAHDSQIHSIDTFSEVLQRIINMPEDDLPPPLHEAENPITVLTMHKSKGLEFDVVFSLGTCSRTVVDELIEEADSEKMRQLYVSLTRAKERLYLFVGLDMNEKTPVYGTASPVELYLASVWKYKNESSDTLYSAITKERLLEAMQYLSEGQRAIEFRLLDENECTRDAPIITSRGVDEVVDVADALENIEYICPIITSFSSIKRSIVKESALAVVPDETLPQGAFFGRKIHAIIERLLIEPREVASSKNRIEEWLIKERLAFSLEKYIEKVSEMLFSLFTLPFSSGSGTFTLLDIEPEDITVERSFFYRKEGEFVQGVIDCIAIHKNTMYIFDWKTEASSQYDEETLSRILITQKYDIQASIYESAAGAYLKERKEISYGGVFFVFLRGVCSGGLPVMYREGLHNGLHHGCIV